MMAAGMVICALNAVLNVNLKNIDTYFKGTMYEGSGKVCSPKCDSGRPEPIILKYLPIILFQMSTLFSLLLGTIILSL